MVKKYIRRLLISFFVPTLFLFATNALAYTSPGTPSGFVNDFADMLSEDAERAIENALVAHASELGNEIAVVTIPSLDGDYIENYAEKLFQEWGIGKKGTDNGVLLLIARDDKKMRIEVGYGLEGALTDAESSQIIRNVLRPAFQKGDFDGGIDAAVAAIENAITGEVVVQTDEALFEEEFVPNEGGGFPFESLFWVLWFVLISGMWPVAILSRSKSWWAGGVLGGIGGLVLGWVLWSLVAGAVGALVVGLLGLLFDFVISKKYAAHKALHKKPPWWAGGAGGTDWSGGGWSSGDDWGGGSDFGGFGGGSSGGGGASGGW